MCRKVTYMDSIGKGRGFGYVLILSNLSILNQPLKISYTRKTPEEKCADLNRQGAIPNDFKVSFSIPTNCPKLLKKLTFAYLRCEKVNEMHGFFNINFDYAKMILEVMNNYISTNSYEEFIDSDFDNEDNFDDNPFDYLVNFDFIEPCPRELNQNIWNTIMNKKNSSKSRCY